MARDQKREVKETEQSREGEMTETLECSSSSSSVVAAAKMFVACAFLVSAATTFISNNNNDSSLQEVASFHPRRQLSMVGDSTPSYMEPLMKELRERKKLFEDTPPEEVKYWFEYTGPLQVRL